METIIEEDLPTQIDCIHYNSRHSLIALGAYQLQIEDTPSTSSPQTRIGRIYILKLTPSIPGGFTVTEEVPTPSGVLDLKWEAVEEELLAVATATSLSLYKINDSSVLPYTEVQLAPDTMALFVQWVDKDNILFSDSQGHVNLAIIQGGDVVIRHKVKIHESLTWVVHYSFEQEIVYCGDDAGTLVSFSLPQLTSPPSSHHTSTRFPLGLTSITTHNELVAIGCYDDTLRIFELTQTNPKVVLVKKFEINLGGAVWRTQWLPNLTSNDDLYIAAACARDGVKLIRINTEIEVVHTVDKYKGFLAYGLHVATDYRFNKYIFYTCYFDNHVIHVYSISI